MRTCFVIQKSGQTDLKFRMLIATFTRYIFLTRFSYGRLLYRFIESLEKIFLLTRALFSYKRFHNSFADIVTIKEQKCMVCDGT